MDNKTMICRMLIKVPPNNDENKPSPNLSRPRDLPEISNSIRAFWVQGMNSLVQSTTEHLHIRPLDFILSLDGSVELQPPARVSSHPPDSYPAAYRIPPETTTDLSLTEQVRRAELFALGSLIYELYAGEAPFEGLLDSEKHVRFCSAEFPKVTHLPQWLEILSCWSVEFAGELMGILDRLGKEYPTVDCAMEEGRFKRYARAVGNDIAAHPVRFGFQCAGTLLGIGAAVTVPVLGAAGFGAMGPIAGSSAVAWQASMGAGVSSLFSWCQSAAMGGAAVNGIIAAGATGGTVALGSTAVGLLTGKPLGKEKEEMLMEKFRELYRKPNGEKLKGSRENKAEGSDGSDGKGEGYLGSKL